MSKNKKDIVYVGKGGQFNGWIFINPHDGNYFSYHNDALHIFIGYGKKLLIKGTKLIPIGTL